MATESKLLDLMQGLFNLYENNENLLSALVRKTNYGNTIGTIVCGWGSPRHVIDFLNRLPTLSIEERVEILSHRNDTHENMHARIVAYQKDPNVNAAFIKCLCGMNPDQEARCTCT
jgi:hypothetical protein